MDKIICKGCGAKNPSYANFCQECGKKIHSEINKDEVKTTKNISHESTQVSEIMQGTGNRY